MAVAMHLRQPNHESLKVHVTSFLPWIVEEKLHCRNYLQMKSFLNPSKTS